jgi:hypothetical protein
MSDEVNGRNGVGRIVHAVLIGGLASVKTRDVFIELGSSAARGKHGDRREPVVLCPQKRAAEKLGLLSSPQT